VLLTTPGLEVKVLPGAKDPGLMSLCMKTFRRRGEECSGNNISPSLHMYNTPTPLFIDDEVI
jgi:hypothetical protein